MLSENVDKIYEFSDYTFDEKEKVLIIATVDYIYWGINVSNEITSDYLLFKQMKNLEDRINKKLDDKYDQINKKFDQINRKFDILFNAIEMFRPEFGLYMANLKKDLQEEKKDSV